ncbi:MAG TPA: hypothetical protein PKI05_10530, partial [Thermogutta sp.]|nr:hypothetical protein [Thermogutta sp.]
EHHPLQLTAHKRSGSFFNLTVPFRILTHKPMTAIMVNVSNMRNMAAANFSTAVAGKVGALQALSSDSRT